MDFYEADVVGLDFRAAAYLTAVGADSRVGYRLSKLTDSYELENKEAERPVDNRVRLNMTRRPETD